MAQILSHIRVLDITRYVAGPWASQILADMGAEVIKIERPGEGDVVRNFGPPFAKCADGSESRESSHFLGLNRGKKSVTVDISTPEGQDLVRQIAASCDVLIENNLVGVLNKFGLGYERIKAIRPDIIYCALSGFGQDGPYRDRAGFDPIIQAMGGLMSINGEPDGPPTRAGIAVSDIMSGMYSATAILGALNHRQISGQGQFIDIALLDSLVATLGSENMRYLILGEVPKRMGSTSRNLTPTQVFHCKEGSLSLAVANDGQFAKLMKVMGRPEVAEDPKFAKNSARGKNRAELLPLLEAIFLTRTAKEWAELIGAAAIPCGQVNDIKAVFEDPQVKHRGLRVELDHAQLGKTPVVASPMRFSATPVQYKGAAPLLGQHTQEVLRDLLKLDEATCKRLAEKGVI